MTEKRFYRSPETETTPMPLEGIVCASAPGTSGMSFGDPFSGNTEEMW